LNNGITGNNDANVRNGAGGNDTLSGAGGNDTLSACRHRPLGGGLGDDFTM
jgi:Ca2+-binding RTX toxin-like protein